MTTTTATLIRVIKTTTTGFGADAQVSESTLWSGTDIEELSTEFPPSDIMFADELGIQRDIEDGFIRFNVRFEQLVGDDTWQEIDDPRVRLTQMTDYELAVDAENRRDFPGDYITVDCDRCGDYGCSECDDPYDYGDSYEDDTDVVDEYDCYNCLDHGCEKCDPEAFPPHQNCSYCCRDFLQKDLDNDKPRCCSCNHVLTDNKRSDGDLCLACEISFVLESFKYDPLVKRLPRKLKKPFGKHASKWTYREKHRFNRFMNRHVYR